MKAILTNVAIATVGCVLASLFWVPGFFPVDSVSWIGDGSSSSRPKTVESDAENIEGKKRLDVFDPLRARQATVGTDTAEPQGRRAAFRGSTTRTRPDGSPLAAPKEGRIALAPSKIGDQKTVRIPPALAFAALAQVGKDEAAEKIWRLAIRDKSLSAEMRSDLIEDLNDTGYPDPDNLTQEDLPLILYRLDLIERLHPHAMDRVNRIAFEEAYMDLLGMWLQLLRRKK